VTRWAAARGGGCSQPGTCFCLNKGIEQVAKLEHANASSKLPAAWPGAMLPPTYLPLQSTLYLMHSLFKDWSISLYKALEYAFE
jgi:hypothetical protein